MSPSCSVWKSGPASWTTESHSEWPVLFRYNQRKCLIMLLNILILLKQNFNTCNFTERNLNQILSQRTHQLKDERLREHDYSCLEGKNGLSHAFNLKVIDLQDIEVFCHQLSNVCVEKVICLGVNFVEKKIHSMNYSYSIAVLFWNCISQHIDIICEILVIRKFIKIDLYTHTTNFHINSNMWMQNQELQIICVCK